MQVKLGARHIEARPGTVFACWLSLLLSVHASTEFAADPAKFVDKLGHHAI